MLRKAVAPPMARRSHQAREQATPCTGRSPTQGTGRAIVRPCCSGVALPSSSPLDYPCYLFRRATEMLYTIGMADRSRSARRSSGGSVEGG